MPNSDIQKYNIFQLLRIIRGKKLNELADELRVEPTYIDEIENGTQFPSDEVLKDYARVLSVDKNLFLTFDPETHKNQKFKNILLSLLKVISKLGP